VQRRKQTIKDISIYTDFLFPVEERHIRAYRYFKLGDGVQLKQDEWSWPTEHMPALRIEREVFPIQENNWPLTTCPVINKDSDEGKQVCDDPGNERDEQIENGDDNDEVSKMDNEQTEEIVLDCPEDGCIAKLMTFGRLNNHVIRGIHRLKP
jgi:hypothetical protein